MPPELAPAVPRFERLADRLNPILVKEVRAALRGRVFAIGFSLVLLLALVASATVSMAQAAGSGAPDGVGYLAGVGAVFGLGAYGLVPFTAMSSMAAEHEEGALEHLALTRVTPGRLVIGKLGAAAVQAALLYAAFLPFLAFGFLLPGVDLIVLCAGLVSAYVVSLAYAALGILLGAALRPRWLRVLGYVFLAIALLVGMQGGAAFTLMLELRGRPAAAASSWSQTYAIVLCGAALFAAGCAVLATRVLTHPEENRSTAFRVLGTSALAVLAVFGALADAPGATVGWLVAGLIAAYPSMLLAVTEKTALPRAVLTRALRRRGPLYGAPWMPGGGRGVLLVAVNFALVLGAAVVAALLAGPARAEFVHAAAGIWVLCVWLCVPLLLIPGLASRRLDRAWVRGPVVASTLLLPWFLMLVPTLALFLLGLPGSDFHHAGNPVLLVEDVVRGRDPLDVRGAWVLVGTACLAVIVNVPRVVASFGEVQRARASAAAPARASIAGGADAASVG